MESLGIYKVTRLDRVGHGEFDTFIVYSHNEQTARETHPSGKNNKWAKKDPHNPHKPNFSKWVLYEDIHTLCVEMLGIVTYLDRVSHSSGEIILAR